MDNSKKKHHTSHGFGGLQACYMLQIRQHPKSASWKGLDVRICEADHIE